MTGTPHREGERGEERARSITRTHAHTQRNCCCERALTVCFLSLSVLQHATPANFEPRGSQDSEKKLAALIAKGRAALRRQGKMEPNGAAASEDVVRPCVFNA